MSIISNKNKLQDLLRGQIASNAATAAQPAAQHKPFDREALPGVVQRILAAPLADFKRDAAAPRTPITPLTNIAFVLDKSGSMSSATQSTIEGFNAQARVVREGARDAGETTFTDVQFNNEITIRRTSASLDGLIDLNEEAYRPEGGTALYDALGDTIEALLSTARIDAPGTATLVTLFTDGEENASRRYNAETVRALIERLEATERWTFALVGPEGGVTTLADQLSVDKTNVSGYDPSSLASRTQAFAAVADASAVYMSQRSQGTTQARGLYSRKPKT